MSACHTRFLGNGSLTAERTVASLHYTGNRAVGLVLVHERGVDHKRLKTDVHQVGHSRRDVKLNPVIQMATAKRVGDDRERETLAVDLMMLDCSP